MNIATVEVSRLTIPYTKPLKIAIGETVGADNVIVKITTDTGIVGWGEASPNPHTVGDSAETSYQTAQKLARLVLGKDPLAIEARMAEIGRFIVGESSIRSAFDMAFYDIAAKAAGMPLYRFLGGERREIRSNLTIGHYDAVAQTVKAAQAILDANFTAIKIKVGRPGLADVAHVAAVRELAGPDVAIKIDSNQGWDYPTAVANITAMAPLDLDYSEQPLPVWDHDGLARLRDKVTLPICADESVFTDKDALKLIRLGAVDYFNIKLGKAGGIHMGLKINAVAEAAGAKCMIGCFGESRLALSAAAHLAMARPNIVFFDLDSAYGFKSDPVIGGMIYDDKIGGLMHLPDSPGHGAAIDEKMLNQTIRITL